MIPVSEAKKIVNNACAEIIESLDSDTQDVSLFELGGLIGSTLLRSSTNSYGGPAQHISRIEAQLSDGIHAGLNLHAEIYGINYRDDMTRNLYGDPLH